MQLIVWELLHLLQLHEDVQQLMDEGHLRAGPDEALVHENLEWEDVEAHGTKVPVPERSFEHVR